MLPFRENGTERQTDTPTLEDGFTQRKKGEITITTLLSERGALVLSSFTSIKKGRVWKADGLAIAGRYGTHINTSVQTLQRLQLLVFQD